MPIAKIVERVTEMPTYIDNDAHAVALGQKLFGMARELKSFMVIMLGKKIGGGSYMQGRLYRGHTGAAGEIGHCVVAPGGPAANAARKAAWMHLPSSSALLRRAAELDLPCTDIE